MVRIGNHTRIRALGFAVCLACLFTAPVFFAPCPSRAHADDQESAGAKKAFLEASEVLFHPRCMNCHPAGETPLTGEDSQQHRFGVTRGTDGKGAGGMNCTLCHQSANQPGGPPGVSNWHMPRESMPMVFQGRTPGELCRQLKDPEQNGGRTGEQLVDHIDSDPLVLWGWDPDTGRMTPEMSHKEFSAKMHEWVEKGCDCPE